MEIVLDDVPALSDVWVGIGATEEPASDAVVDWRLEEIEVEGLGGCGCRSGSASPWAATLLAAMAAMWRGWVRRWTPGGGG